MLIAAAVTASSLGCTPTDEPPRGLRGAANGWNLVLVSIDTLRADRLNSWGYQGARTSQAIDRLSTGGIRFANAHSPRSLTWPSLASVLTGLYPSSHGLISNGYRFQDGQSTLPLLLQNEGYQTGAFLSNMCQANHQGWAEFFCAGGVDKRVNRRALAWLDSIEADRPIFLWTHYFGPHPPYYNGGNLAASTLDPGYTGDLKPKKHALDRVMDESIELDAADRRHLDALYDAAVIGTDRYIDELVAGLAQRIDMERTIIVLLSDHGEDLYQHNRYLYHACSVYQSSLHVPLILAAPGLIPAGSTVDQPVELTDVMPTLLDLLSVEGPQCLDGRSLIGYLERPERGSAGKVVLSEYGETRIGTLREGDWKLISNPDAVTPKCFAGGPDDLYPIDTVELYDLASDPAEALDLASQHPTRVDDLRTKLEARRSSLCGDGAQPQDIPEELKKELEALGYVAD